ncbi:ubiquitin fusion degradation protein 1 [Sporothrix brasiliensis 5110]|uniref:Ubiquitin fusion degradation protein 1 n=1 Tax=Sporothrix brasiliensis 5110 TaxID=1398154 RepID=A0A0C2J0Q8_9PEZI|nr:ubiquitin fusion degradation protein 1 [Sporothrix brasiliensis 5110]KIH94976.1 ubiquitin fusion degradation protein 1 [Sporothrix brasiliensis 5110]
MSSRRFSTYPAYNTGYGFDPRRGGRGAATMRFDEYYRCYPMAMAPGNDRPELNYGSKILLPPSALDKVSRLHVQWPLLMEMVNAEKGKHSHCGVLEFVAEEGRAYIPQWMMQTLQLDVGDMIQIKTTSLELARMVKLQPQSPAFLDISDPKAVLERAFRNFATLTKGDIFSFEYNSDVYDVAVLEVKPETDKMGVSMIETDVSVDFAPPVGYVEPDRSALAAAAKNSGTSTPRSVAGTGLSGGLPAGGVLHSQGSMAQAINYDAIAPGSAAHVGTNFEGEGHRIGTKKGKGTAATTASSASTPKKPSTPVAGVSSNKAEGSGNTRRRMGPQPLRLPANKLFFGYHIRPVKTKEQKEEEAANAGKPQYFAGQGQSLRVTQALKKKGSDKDDESSGTEKKPRR